MKRACSRSARITPSDAGARASEQAPVAAVRFQANGPGAAVFASGAELRTPFRGRRQS
jgi:hypothetical protein